LTHGTAEFEAVLAGDHDVEHEERRSLPLGVAENVRTGGVDPDRETVVFQVVADKARNIRIVFDDEDARFHGIIVAEAVAST
jgi:hypothetical protein